MAHRYCPECGFQNPETANYCSKCGSLLVREEADEATMAFTPEHAEEEGQAELEDFGIKGPALVVRSGGGRAGETFVLDQERTTVGRSPECDIFLDDVTVSRRHAVVARKGGDHLEIEDLGSLNGTFLNRKRIESSAPLADGDELQIGKYRLTFLQ
jgi:pSer/pThr/pTyr-binding forkhead associated (FHA) protein/ribosomal protein L40E